MKMIGKAIWFVLKGLFMAFGLICVCVGFWSLFEPLVIQTWKKEDDIFMAVIMILVLTSPFWTFPIVIAAAFIFGPGVIDGILNGIGKILK